MRNCSRLRRSLGSNCMPKSVRALSNIVRVGAGPAWENQLQVGSSSRRGDSVISTKRIHFRVTSLFHALLIPQPAPYQALPPGLSSLSSVRPPTVSGSSQLAFRSSQPLLLHEQGPIPTQRVRRLRGVHHAVLDDRGALGHLGLQLGGLQTWVCVCVWLIRKPGKKKSKQHTKELLPFGVTWLDNPTPYL